MGNDDLVLTEVRDDSVGVVTLNRPDRLNALSMDMTTAITEAFGEMGAERDVSVVVLRGNGKGFCAGADVKGDGSPPPDSEGRGQVGTNYRAQEHLARMIQVVHECPKPVITAAHGASVGGGLALALAADMRVATPETRFGAVFHNLGLSAADVGVSWFLPRVVGPTRAAELMMSGRIFTGEEADGFGMLNRLVPADELLDAALELAALVTRNSEYGIWMSKKGMWLAMDAPSLRHAMEMENRTQVLGLFTGNLGAGVEAAMTKTDPDWKPM
ncbi:MAG: enoyl-CoA hydratase/isomerase family protein [Actinomycetia bacterium]|nr:enoyl-CoA hydratase/isomerase family protein [Actinomycetes bacterium]